MGVWTMGVCLNNGGLDNGGLFESWGFEPRALCNGGLNNGGLSHGVWGLSEGAFTAGSNNASSPDRGLARVSGVWGA
eukprot:3936863-Rhodomonas_salina.2